MGGLALLHPQDVLKDRSNFNHMPLKSNPNSNSNRRKRSPQKKTNDLSRSPPSKVGNIGRNFNGGDGLLRSPVKGDGKIDGSPNLVMGKVKILKRGEALTNFENSEKKTVSFDENEVILKRGQALYEKLEKKTVSFKENEIVLKRGEALSEKVEKKTVSFDKKMVVRKNEDVKRNDDLESIENLLKRWGPDPDMVPKKINLVDFYAGSGCFISPDPSSVPVPDFFKSKHLRSLLNLAF